ncbi:MAG TPA: FHA domain-containing protein [Verrucomicrobiae bacterium]|jgi:pSer/pThr/pTyr-binding forkhead associated (FHA) protein|nr:FHA domain-containing protein [Verrucomicrobiae bacterium]
MAKLVVLSAGMNGRTHELNVDKTTIGRVDDNTFQIADPSVSSHHCEVLLRGTDVVVHDLNSTNGSFINGDKVSESVLKPGQTLRLGQIELQLLTEGMPIPAPRPAPAPATGAPAASAPTAGAPVPSGQRKHDSTMVVPRGVNLTELSEGGARQSGFDTTSKGFSKKKNNTTKMFIIGAIVVAVVICIVLVVVFSQLH